MWLFYRYSARRAGKSLYTTWYFQYGRTKAAFLLKCYKDVHKGDYLNYFKWFIQGMEKQERRLAK